MNHYMCRGCESQLDDGLQSVVRGQGSAWLVLAPPGHGKSRLLDQLRSKASGLTGIRIQDLRCLGRAEPACESLGARTQGETDVESRGRLLPNDADFQVVATLLSRLGEDTPTVEKGLSTGLMMVPSRIARRGVSALVEVLVGQMLPTVSAGVSVAHLLQDILGTRDRDGLDARRLADMFFLSLESALERQPTLLLVDDAHWLDAPSCTVLFQVIRRHPPLPVMVVMAAREHEMRTYADGEVAHPLLRLASASLTDCSLQELRLESWSRETVVQYLAGRCPGLERDAEFVELLWRKTDGLPLFVVELLALLEQSGRLVQQAGRWRRVGELTSGELPASIRELIRDRLHQAGDDITRIVERASVEGQEFHFAVVRALVGTEDDHELNGRLLAAEHYFGLIERLLDERLDWLGGLFAFSHALIHEYVYAQIPLAAQRELHGIVADELVRLGPDQQARLATEIVRHARLSGQGERVVEYSLPAAEQALALYNWPRALAYATGALDMLPRGVTAASGTVLGLKKVQAEALYRERRWDEAVHMLEKLLSMATALDRQDVVADALCLLSHIAGIRGDARGAMTLSERAVAVACRAGDDNRELASLVSCHRALQAVWPVEERFPFYRQTFLPSLERMLHAAERADDRRKQARICRWLARVARTLRDEERTALYLKRGMALARATGDYRVLVELYYLQIELVSATGDEASIIGEYRASVEAAELTGDPKVSSDLLCNFGSRLKEFGRFQEAREVLGEALRLGDRLGAVELLCMARGNLASLAEAEGLWAEAQTHHREHLRLAGEVDNRGGLNAASLGLARTHLRMGQPRECLAMLETLVWSEHSRLPERAEGLILEARAQAALSCFDEAGQALRSALEVATAAGDTWWVAQALITRAELAKTGVAADAAEDLRRAVAELRALVERWPASVPLAKEYERARRLQDGLGPH